MYRHAHNCAHIHTYSAVYIDYIWRVPLWNCAVIMTFLCLDLPWFLCCEVLRNIHIFHIFTTVDISRTLILVLYRNQKCIVYLNLRTECDVKCLSNFVSLMGYRGAR
jgi:hypothetical protein